MSVGTFNHRECYKQFIHSKSPSGRRWCRKHGPLSEIIGVVGRWFAR